MHIGLVVPQKVVIQLDVEQLVVGSLFTRATQVKNDLRQCKSGKSKSYETCLFGGGKLEEVCGKLVSLFQRI